MFLVVLSVMRGIKKILPVQPAQVIGTGIYYFIIYMLDIPSCYDELLFPKQAKSYPL